MDKSTLHRQNLSEVLGVQPAAGDSVDSAQSSANAYRDRAKERRMKFGTDVKPEFKNSLKVIIYFLVLLNSCVSY